MVRYILDSVKIKKGSVMFEDYTSKTPFTFAFKGIGFELKDVDSDEGDGLDAKLRLFTTLGDGGFIDFRGEIYSLSSLKVKGSLNYEASKLYTQWKYFQDSVNLEVADGKVSFFTDYTFFADDENATSLENLSLELQNLRIKPKNKTKDILKLDRLVVYDAKIFPLKQNAEIQNLALSGLTLWAKRSKKGTIDWSNYLKIASSKSTSAKEPSLPWDLNLSELSLEDFAFNFEDEALTPSVKTKIDELNVHVQDLTLLGERPSPYMLHFTLNKKAECASQGILAHKNIDLQGYFECKGVDLAHYNSYIESAAKEALKSYNINLKRATASFSSSLHLQKIKKELQLQLIDANLAVNNCSLLAKSDKKEFLNFSTFAVNGVNLQTQKKSLEIKKIILNKAVVNIEKNRDASLNVAALIEPKEDMQEEKNERPYSVVLKHFGLKNASVIFSDNSLEKGAKNSIKNIYANVYNATSNKGSWLTYDANMQLNSQAKFSSKGKVSHTPLKQTGSFELKNLSLVALTPYLQESAHVSVEDGRFSLSGTTEYEQNADKADLRVKGSALLSSLFLNDTLNETQLLSLGEANVQSYTLELSPSRLYIDELDVNSFYVDASIDEKSRLNFSKLLKTKISQESSNKQTQEQDGSKFPYKIAKANLTSGSAKFADYSIPLKFFTHIHNLNGSVYSISSEAGDTSYVDVAGEIDKYASMKINGSIDSGDPKIYTDINLRFKNVDLSSLSGYSANFAGYKIDSGKLYLDLGYEIQNAKLIGKNSIIIEKIKVGKRVRDKNVTALPLRFVIGLLEDSSGVIDINMPIEGDMNNPKFRYGKVVRGTMTKLIASAVTSPFRFLGSVMGLGGAEFEYIAYEAGSAVIDPPQREKLDTIAQLMQTKPKIVLGLAGQYEAKKDKEALQMKMLVDLVVQKSGIKNIQDHRSVMTTEMLEEIYEEIDDDSKLEQTQKRLKELHKDEMLYERAYNKELITMCRDIQPFDEEELIVLAQIRAQNILNYLVNEKMLDPKRIDLKAFKHVKKSSDMFVKLLLELEVK